jgi:hypothetical protein
VHDDLHTADGAPAQVVMVSSNTARHGRGYATYATAAGGMQGLQALSPRHWPPLGAFIKLPALRVVHDLVEQEIRYHGSAPSHKMMNGAILPHFQPIGITRTLEVHDRDPRISFQTLIQSASPEGGRNTRLQGTYREVLLKSTRLYWVSVLAVMFPGIVGYLAAFSAWRPVGP